MRGPLVAAVLSAMAAIAAADNEASDKMKGVGQPIFYMVIFAIVVFFTHKTLLNAHKNYHGDPQLIWSFRCCMICAALSLLLVWTPAWNYALVSLIIALVMAFVCSSDSFSEHGQKILIGSVLWLLILVGIPDKLSTGIINTVTLSNCNSYYNTYKSTMCMNGWVVITEILATVHIGFSLVAMLTIAGAVVNAPKGGIQGSQSESLIPEKASA